MSASGNIHGSVTQHSGHFAYWIHWVQDQMNASNNTSRVSAWVYVQRTGSYKVESSRNSHNLYIAGAHFHANPYVNMNPNTNPVLLVSGSVYVGHDADGHCATPITSDGSICDILDPYYRQFSPLSGNAGTWVALASNTRAVAVSSVSPSSVGGTSATVRGNVTDAGLPRAHARGIHWGTSAGSLPNWIQSGSGAGAFNVNITGLARGTTYYYRAGAINTSHGWRHGSTLSFTTTATTPSVSTSSPATNISFYSATVSGNVTNANGATVTTRGICYNTTGSPTTSSPKVASGSGTGSFSSSLTGLNPNTTYYARAYATNSQGTAYGGQISFKTLIDKPSVTTGNVTYVGMYGATFAGEVTASNGATVTERGFVYNTSGNPTTSHNKMVVGSGLGSYSESIATLGSGTKYYMRAYAINSQGTSYGVQRIFSTKPGNPSGLEVISRDKDTIGLSWTKGENGLHTIIKRGLTAPSNINSGTLVYSGTSNTFEDTGLVHGETYVYRAWSATTADWSEAYSDSYTQKTETTIADFADPEHALVDDSDYAEVFSGDTIYAQISRDGGSTWSPMHALTFGADIQAKSFGSGDTELWEQLAWKGNHVGDANFKVRLISEDGESYQVYTHFGHGINPIYLLTGVNVTINAAYHDGTFYLYYIKTNPHYGTSPLPVKGGSLVYDSKKNRPSYFNNSKWVPMGGGSKVTVSINEPPNPQEGDIWIDVSGS